MFNQHSAVAIAGMALVTGKADILTAGEVCFNDIDEGFDEPIHRLDVFAVEVEALRVRIRSGSQPFGIAYPVKVVVFNVSLLDSRAKRCFGKARLVAPSGLADIEKNIHASAGEQINELVDVPLFIP